MTRLDPRFRGQVLVAAVQDEGGQRTSRRGKPPEELASTLWAPDIRVSGEEVAVSRLLGGSDGPLDVAAEGLAL